jgi:hypothetical protein
MTKVLKGLCFAGLGAILACILTFVVVMSYAYRGAHWRLGHRCCINRCSGRLCGRSDMGECVNQVAPRRSHAPLMFMDPRLLLTSGSTRRRPVWRVTKRRWMPAGAG